MTDKDDMNPYRPPEAELIDPQFMENQVNPSAPWDGALSITIVMFLAFFVCLFCGPFRYLQWVHHVCFLIIALYCIYSWRKNNSWWFLIPMVFAVVLWGILDAISFVPLG